MDEWLAFSYPLAAATIIGWVTGGGA